MPQLIVGVDQLLEKLADRISNDETYKELLKESLISVFSKPKFASRVQEIIAEQFSEAIETKAINPIQPSPQKPIKKKSVTPKAIETISPIQPSPQKPIKKKSVAPKRDSSSQSSLSLMNLSEEEEEEEEEEPEPPKVVKAPTRGRKATKAKVAQVVPLKRQPNKGQAPPVEEVVVSNPTPMMKELIEKRKSLLIEEVSKKQPSASQKRRASVEVPVPAPLRKTRRRY